MSQLSLDYCCPQGSTASVVTSLRPAISQLFRNACRPDILFSLALSCDRMQANQALTMRAHFINVGQGEVFLFEFPCGADLMDAGAQDEHYVEAPVTYLSNFFRRRPDLRDKGYCRSTAFCTKSVR